MSKYIKELEMRIEWQELTSLSCHLNIENKELKKELSEIRIRQAMEQKIFMNDLIKLL